MPRTIDPILEDALANQKGNTFVRVLTWTDLSAYNAAPTTPKNTFPSTRYTISATSASATIISQDNDFTNAAFEVFIIERGLNILGTEYPVQSGIYFVRDFIEAPGRIKIKGSSFPNIKITMAGDDTYQNVITQFCTDIGKTAVFQDSSAAWLSYQMLPTGKQIILNKAERFENLIRQKYLIHVYERSPKELVFYQPDNIFELKSICWSSELLLFVAVGSGTLLSSSNGITWDTRTIPESNTWQSVAWSPSLSIFAAVSSDGTNRVMTSPDGITWTSRSAAEQNFWAGIAWSPSLSLFVAVASTGTNRVMTSPDGITWTSRSITTSSWTAVTWSPSLSLFVAVAQSGTTQAATSPNGITWTNRTTPLDGYRSVTWSPELSLFAAVSPNTGGEIITSPDGITWTSRTNPSSKQLDSIAWSPELLLFVATAISGTNRVITSPDGITWTDRTIPDKVWEAVTWSPELSLFVAVAFDSLPSSSSSDGITWTNQFGLPDFYLTYLDGIKSTIEHGLYSTHFIARDETESINIFGDQSLPAWNLGYLDSSSDPPHTREDPFYKFSLQKAPVRLDITDGDRIHFSPSWQLDPTKSIDAMVLVTEIFDTSKEPAWFQEINSLSLFDSVEGGTLPSTIERVAAYTPLVSTGFDGNLSPSINNLQALAQAVDDLDLSGEVKPDGWIPKTEVWTRTGNHTFTLNGDYSTDPAYQPGILIRYKDGGSYEYGVIYTNAHVSGTTTINLIPNTDYAMAAATITDTAVSRITNPEGFPAAFNFSPSPWVALGTGTPTYTSVSVDTAIWQPMGKRKLHIVIVATGTTGGTTVTSIKATLPVTLASNLLAVPAANYGSTGAPRVGTGALTTTEAVVRAFDNSDMGIGSNRYFRWDATVQY